MSDIEVVGLIGFVTVLMFLMFGLGFYTGDAWAKFQMVMTKFQGSEDTLPESDSPLRKYEEKL